MQPRQYFVVVLAHSLHGRLRRVHIPHQAIYAVLVLALIGCVSVTGFVLSYARMTWKVANYNSLRSEVNSLRAKYRDLQLVSNQKTQQLATLGQFAREVSMAYDMSPKTKNAGASVLNTPLMPTFRESLEDYNFLKSASFSSVHQQFPKQWLTDTKPSIWPVNGRLLSPWGRRTDPFSGEGASHTGVDISAPIGTPVHAAADGVVAHAEWDGGYGKLVIIDHGNGFQTYYAHLSRFEVMAGQEVRAGQVIAQTGATGRVTSPHLHYEVRIGLAPVNPYIYLTRSMMSASAARLKDFPF